MDRRRAPRRCVARGAAGPGCSWYQLAVDPTGAESPVFVQRPRALARASMRRPSASAAGSATSSPKNSSVSPASVDRAVALAGALAGEYGIGKGDRVAIAAANSPEYLLTLCACAKLGAISVGLNGWWTGPEMQHGIALTEPRLSSATYRRRSSASAQTRRHRWSRSKTASRRCQPTHRRACPTPPIDENDPYVIVFTSGTTGRAKGATLSHRSQIDLGLASLLGASVNAAIHPPPASGDSVVPCSIMVGPLFHVSGLNPFWLTAITGAKVVHPPSGRWHEKTSTSISPSSTA